MTNETNTRPLQPGDVVQYRKVGQARVTQCTHLHDATTGAGWWDLEWIKAPKSYRGKTTKYWVDATDRIAV